MGITTIGGAGLVTRKRQMFTSSGTFTLPAGYGTARPLYVDVTVVGGGGAGGAGSTGNHSPGGGGGGCVRKTVLGLTGNIPVVVGAGGTWTGGNGGNGGDSMVGYTASAADNLIPNPFMTNGQNFDTTSWSGSTIYGTISALTTGDYSATPTWRHTSITDAANPTGFFKSNYGWYFYSSSSGQYQYVTNDYITVSASTLYYFGMYTQSSTSAAQQLLAVDWYDSSNNPITSSTLSYTTTTLNKYSSSATSPSNAAKAKIRWNTNMTSAGYVNIFGMYFSRTINYCPWESQSQPVYWTGTRYYSTLAIMPSTNLVSGYSPIIAGGGGGGMQVGDAGENSTEAYRWGGIGGHQGGFSRSNGNTTSDRMHFGGDGGGAGGSAYRERFNMNNATTPYSGPYPWDDNSNIPHHTQRTPNLGRSWGRHMGGNTGSMALYTTTTAGVAALQMYEVRGGAPDPVTGFSAGGPGAGYWWPQNQPSYQMLKQWQHYKMQPYGNGGAGDNQSQSTTTQGYINYHVNGDWSRNGDQGVVIFEWLEA